MNWNSLFPLNIIPKGDGKQSGFTKIRNEIDRIYTILSGTNSGGKLSVSSLETITATNIENIAIGNITSTDVQTAINELSNRLPLGRNKIINGDMLIDQRNNGASQTFTSGANPVYCVDRWYASCIGANITGQQVASTGVYSKSYRFTGAAGNTGALFGQRIEAVNCRDLLSKDVKVQVELSSSSITSVTWTAYYANTIDTFSAKTQIATGTIAITATPTVYNFGFNTGTNARNGICIEITTGALLATQTLVYSGIQLEKGLVATPFEHLEFGEVLRKCQRYYEKTVDNEEFGFSGNVTSGYSYYLYIHFKVVKRISPTVNVSLGSIISFPSSNPENIYPNINGFRCSTPNASSSSVGIYRIGFTAESEL